MVKPTLFLALSGEKGDSYLNPAAACEDPRLWENRFADLLDRIKVYHPDINLPVFVVMDERMAVPTSLNGGGQYGPLPREPQQVAALIEKYIEGNETIYKGQRIPIRAVIDFTQRRNVGRAYALLEEKFDIRRLWL